MRRVVLKQGIWDSRICLFNYIYIFFYQKQRLLPRDKYSLELATPSPAPHTNPNIIGKKKRRIDAIKSNRIIPLSPSLSNFLRLFWGTLTSEPRRTIDGSSRMKNQRTRSLGRSRYSHERLRQIREDTFSQVDVKLMP